MAAQIQKSVQEFKWETNLYEPIGTSHSPPIQWQWKATDEGQKFIRNDPNGRSFPNGIDWMIL